jgi:hypothetical protein
MARLRATASAARSVLDRREHDGTLGGIGKPITPAPRTIKKLPHNTIKKPAHAYLPDLRIAVRGLDLRT